MTRTRTLAVASITLALVLAAPLAAQDPAARIQRPAEQPGHRPHLTGHTLIVPETPTTRRC